MDGGRWCAPPCAPPVDPARLLRCVCRGRSSDPVEYISCINLHGGGRSLSRPAAHSAATPTPRLTRLPPPASNAPPPPAPKRIAVRRMRIRTDVLLVLDCSHDQSLDLGGARINATHLSSSGEDGEQVLPPCVLVASRRAPSPFRLRLTVEGTRALRASSCPSGTAAREDWSPPFGVAEVCDHMVTGVTQARPRGVSWDAWPHGHASEPPVSALLSQPKGRARWRAAAAGRHVSPPLWRGC